MEDSLVLLMDQVPKISLSISSAHQIPISMQGKGLLEYHLPVRSFDQIINQSSQNLACPKHMSIADRLSTTASYKTLT
jgi:hypothetical protein